MKWMGFKKYGKMLKCIYSFSAVLISIINFFSVSVFSQGIETAICNKKKSIGDFMEKEEESKILKLETTYNTRDLGGYKTLNGMTTKKLAFIRSDDTDELTENEILKIKSYGIKTVIDMRDKGEIAKHPDKLNTPDFDYYHVDVKENYSNHYNRTDVHMSDGYIDFINYTNENWLKEVFDIISNAKEGGILFHCVSGKDRTGLVAAFLLGLADVPQSDIVNDYSISWDLVKNRPKIQEVYRQKSLLYENYDFSIDASTPERIQKVLDYVKENYDSFENYFLSCGISQDNLNKIKYRFVN